MTWRGDFLSANKVISTILVLMFLVALSAPSQQAWGDSADVTRYDPPRPAPGFQLDGLDGDSLDLDAFRGEIVLVNFWATWCAPCVKELPALDRLHNAFDGGSPQVVGIAVRQWAVDIEDFLEARPEIDVSFPLLPDRDGVATTDWDVGTLPTTFIIDGDGMIHYRIVGDPDWDADEMRDKVRRLEAGVD